MSMTDEELAERLDKAYEALGPSGEAEARMLEALLAAQQAKAAEALQEAAAPAAPARRARVLKFALPIAAALLVAAIVVPLSQQQASSPALTPMQEEVAYEAEPSAAESADGSAYEAKSDAAAPAAADAALAVELEDGLVLICKDALDDADVAGLEAHEGSCELGPCVAYETPSGGWIVEVEGHFFSAEPA